MTSHKNVAYRWLYFVDQTEQPNPTSLGWRKDIRRRSAPSVQTASLKKLPNISLHVVAKPNRFIFFVDFPFLLLFPRIEEMDC